MRDVILSLVHVVQMPMLCWLGEAVSDAVEPSWRLLHPVHGTNSAVIIRCICFSAGGFTRALRHC